MQIAFVCGVARSGTTALAKLLNSHPQVCIGMERYKYLFMRRQPVSVALFDKERFFDIRPEDTNAIPGSNRPILAGLGPAYRAMSDKWTGARIIGDKIPHLFDVLPHTFAAFPNAKIIYILRDIEGVAASWIVRADNASDSWPSEAGLERAVQTWNRANKILHRQKVLARESVFTVSYERLFGGNPIELLRLCRFLNICPALPMLKAYFRLVWQNHRTIVKKPRTSRVGQAEFIERWADRALSAELLNR